MIPHALLCNISINQILFLIKGLSGLEYNLAARPIAIENVQTQSFLRPENEKCPHETEVTHTLTSPALRILNFQSTQLIAIKKNPYPHGDHEQIFFHYTRGLKG
jgi:hypothetical protein